MRSAFIAACVTAGACAGTIAPRTAPQPPPREALLVLPGFGYGNKAEHALRTLAPAMAGEGIDLYVPTYLERSGLEDSRDTLKRFIGEQRLGRYERVHVFAFLAGGWTFNLLAEDQDLLPNLASVVYDRSPYQERAPRIAAERLAPFAWLRYGRVLFELARTPYRPLPERAANVGIIVETEPTSLVKRFDKTARSYGPYSFDCAALAQPHVDCMYAALNHGEMYTHFGQLWPEVRAFLRDGRFSPTAVRTPPEGIR